MIGQLVSAVSNKSWGGSANIKWSNIHDYSKNKCRLCYPRGLCLPIASVSDPPCLGLFSSPPNWDPPHLFIRRRVSPPLVPGGGTHTLGRKWVGRSQLGRLDRHRGTLGIYVLYAQWSQCSSEIRICIRLCGSGAGSWSRLGHQGKANFEQLFFSSNFNISVFQNSSKHINVGTDTFF